MNVGQVVRPRLRELLRFLPLLLLALPPWAGAAPSSFLPDAARVVVGPSMPAVRADASGLLLEGELAKVPERLMWDIPLEGELPAGARSLVLRYAVRANESAAAGFSAHLRTPRGWFAYPDPLPLAGEGRATMQLSRFQSENGAKGPPVDADAIRLSIWKGPDTAAGATTLLLTGLSAAASRIAVVQSTAATAGAEAGVAALCARRCEKALEKAGLSCDVIDDAFDDLSPFSVVFLPYSPKLDGAKTRRLLSYLAGGGKLFVFYNPTASLARRFDLERPLWKGASGARGWHTMAPAEGFPKRGAPCPPVPHFTENILPPRPAEKGKARVVANWESTRIPACSLAPCGAWFAHLPPLPYPATVLFYRALLSEIAPELLKGTEAPSSVAPPVDRTPPATNELRAVWMVHPAPRHPKGWDGLFADWTDDGSVNTVLFHCDAYVKGGGSPSGRRSLSRAIDAAKANRIDLHGWLTCWTASGLTEAHRKTLRDEGRLFKGCDGTARDWLCPDHPENRAEVKKWILDLAGLGVKGVHLDYLRYPDETPCTCETTRKAFEKKIGRKVADWPRDILRGGPDHDAFETFRKDSLTSWLEEVREALRKDHPGTVLSVAVFGSTAGASSVGQDVKVWCEKGLVDWIAPMDYTSDLAAFRANLDGYLSLPVPPSRIVVGIGTGADECQLDGGQTAWQVEEARRRGCLGHAFFQDDASLRAILKGLPR